MKKFSNIVIISIVIAILLQMSAPLVNPTVMRYEEIDQFNHYSTETELKNPIESYYFCEMWDTVADDFLFGDVNGDGKTEVITLEDHSILRVLGDDGNVLADCGPVSNTYNSAGLYDVTLTVTSDQGCIGTDTYSNYIEVVPYPQASFSFAPNELTILDTEVDFTNSSLYADSYTWSFGDQSAASSEENPTHTFPDASGGSYTVTLQAHSNAGCYDQVTAVITIDDVLLYYVPNTFTPDGNSINNEFFPVFTAGYDLYDYHLTIFNRWGEIIFESYNPGVGWDGTYGGVLVEDGVYIWQLEFGETMSDKRHKKRGHVTVLK